MPLLPGTSAVTANDLGKIRWLNLPPLEEDQPVARVSADVANLLDVGFILRARGELVMVVGFSGEVRLGQSLGEPCEWFQMALERGYNGTPKRAHAEGRWELVYAPEYRWGQ